MAQGKYNLHSPFVFNLYTKVMFNKVSLSSDVELYRKKLLKNDRLIKVNDLGAGSKVDRSNERRISSIAKNALKSRKEVSLILNLIKEFKPNTILELGTCFGITTAHLSKESKARVISIEGCSSIYNVAQETFEKLNCSNINSVNANFDDVLINVLKDNKIDFAFVDGNHAKVPTLNYFNQIIENCSEDAVLIFDDIYWSPEMTEAWEVIKKDKRVNVTIDLFHFGIVFKRSKQEKENFILKF